MEHMPEIFQLNILTFESFTGRSLLLLLYVLSVLFILIREKKTWIRLVLGGCPLIVLLMFFFPPVRLVYDKLLGESTTFYRVLWLVPFALTIGYALVNLFANHRRIGLAICCILIALCGKNVYKNPIVSKAENPYHLQQSVIDVVSMIAPEDEYVLIRACVPLEMVHQVRQYNVQIVLVYGRNSVEPEWGERYGVYNEVYELMVLPEEIDMAALNAALKKAECNYLVLGKERKVSASPEDYDWKIYGETEGYTVYESSHFPAP